VNPSVLDTTTLDTTALALEVPLASLAITGPDAFRFLQGQVTNDLSQLTETPQLLAAICTPDGKLVTITSIQQVAPDYLRIITYREHATLLSERLRHFQIRVKVEIHPEEVGWLADADPQPTPLWPLDSRLQPNPTSGEPMTLANFTRLRLKLLATHLPIDAPETELLVAGVPALVSNGVSFTKGCYVGQELVARTDSRNAKPPISLFVRRFTPTSYTPFARPVKLPLTLRTESDDEAGEVRALLLEDTSVVISGWVKRRFSDHVGLLIDGLTEAAPIPVTLVQ
jgi:folate-binding protein YgfZ